MNSHCTIFDFEDSAYWILATLAHTDPMFAHLSKKYPMTPTLFQHCLHHCQVNHKVEKYKELQRTYPAFTSPK